MGNALVQSATIQNKAQAGGGFGSVPPDAPPVTGDPVISGVSGTFAQGNVLTISGSNFSANRSGQLLYEDFESETVGTAPASITQDTGVGEHYKIDSSQSFSGNKSAMVDYVVNNPEFEPRFVIPESDRVVMTAAVRFEKIVEGDDLAGGRQIKMFRFTGDNPLDVIHGRPVVSTTWDVKSGGIQVSGGGVPATNYFGGIPQLNEWMTVTIEWGKNSAQGVADGYRDVKGYGWGYADRSGQDGNFRDTAIDAPNLSPIVPRTTNTVPLTDPVEEWRGMSNVLLPMYMRDSMHYKIWVDCVFINDSSERVVFGDNPDFNLCTQSKLVTQPINSRALDSIEIQCEEGPLSTGPVYAFVYNENGETNPIGFTVRAA